MSTEKTSVLGYLVCFVVGALLSAGIVHKSAAGKLRDVNAKLDQITNENSALKTQAADAVEAEKEARAEASKAKTTAAQDSTVGSASPDAAARALTMQVVRDHLKDPASATFGDIRLVKTSTGKVACGMVNARNSFGGLTGMKPFTVMFSDERPDDSPEVHLDMSLDWLAFCQSVYPST